MIQGTDPSPVLSAKPQTESSSKVSRRCNHCGTAFQPRFEEEQFCCSGCRVVHDLIEAGGFGSFYRLLDGRSLQPVENGDIPADQLDEMEEAVGEAEENRSSETAPAHLRLRVGNLSCTACVWLIDHLFRQHEGALKITSDTTRSILTMWWNPGEFDAIAFIHDLHRYGYPASLVGEFDDGGPAESQSLLTRLGVTGGLAMNTMVFSLPSYLGLETSNDLSRLFTVVAFGSATLALAVGGSYFFQRAFSAWKARVLHMDVPISLGLVAAYLGSILGLLFQWEEMLYFDFVATFAFLMLGGRWLHLRLLEKNRRQLWARERDLSATFRINPDGERERIALRKVEKGDRLDVPAGGMVPVESRLDETGGRFHLDWINGEPEPVKFASGQHIPAGARNGENTSILLVATEAFSGSFLEQLIAKDESAPSDADDEKSTGYSNPILRYYLVTVLVVAFLGGAAWMFSGAGVAPSLQVFVSVLVVSCPCALGLALPLLDEMLLSKLKQKGIFLRNHSIWRRIKKVENLVFDKTGTLTEPVKRLRNEDVLENLSDPELLALRHLTLTNHHPVGKALHEAVVARFGLQELKPVAIEEFPGSGVAVTIDGIVWRLGRSDWAEGSASSTKGATVFSADEKVVGEFELDESIREGALDQLKELRERNYRLSIFSGDPDRERVLRTADQLGLAPEDVHSDLSPEGKADLVRNLKGESTLFVGDGGNDSLAFREAGVTGTPATGIRAIEGQADFVFTGRGFHALGLLLEAADRRNILMKLVFATAILYNIIAVAICLAGWMNPLLAAVLMPISSIVTTAIASRV